MPTLLRKLFQPASKYEPPSVPSRVCSRELTQVVEVIGFEVAYGAPRVIVRVTTLSSGSKTNVQYLRLGEGARLNTWHPTTFPTDHNS